MRRLYQRRHRRPDLLRTGLRWSSAPVTATARLATRFTPTSTPPLTGTRPWLGADFNNDGRLDVFTLQGEPDSAMHYATVLLGRSDGRFDLWESFTFYDDLYDYPTNLWTGDIGCDGLTDVIWSFGLPKDGGLDGNDDDYYALTWINDGNWGTSEPPPPALPHLSDRRRDRHGRQHRRGRRHLHRHPVRRQHPDGHRRLRHRQRHRHGRQRLPGRERHADLRPRRDQQDHHRRWSTATASPSRTRPSSST